jgi:hypothetical protein
MITSNNFERKLHHTLLGTADVIASHLQSFRPTRKEGYVKIQNILERWLEDVKAEVEAGGR